MINNQYIEVNLTTAEKTLIMELASVYIMDATTKEDLMNTRKKWIRFKANTISDVVGELSYNFNHCDNSYKSERLDELIDHLEFYEKNV